MTTDSQKPTDSNESSTIALDPETQKSEQVIDATCDLAPDTDVDALSQGATIGLNGDAKPDPIGAATCDIAPEPPPVVGLNTAPTMSLDPSAKPDPLGAATCDIEPEPPPVIGLNTAPTIALDPSAKPGVIGDATCELPPEGAAGPFVNMATCDIDAPAVGAATCDVAELVGAETHRRATFDLNTNSIPKNATSGFVPGGETSGKSGKDTQAKSSGRQTSQRAVGEVTNPGLSVDGIHPVPQEQAGRFVFKKFHAKGGMGEVWLCEDSDIGRPVALKRMLKGRQKHKNQFIKEAQVTGQLEHPGVIPVHELSLDDKGQPYYVMKFVHGKTLKDVIREFHEQKPTPPSPPLQGGDLGGSREVAWLRLLKVFINLCQTIAYAHSRGVIHRDIKPDNVMVGAYGETLVLDWGLAKIIGEPESDEPYAGIRVSEFEDTQASVSGSVKGTPFYFAPEVASGEVEKVDHVSDVFLLGGTLYEMVTGRPPRKADKMPALLEMARTVTPLPARQIDPTVPKPLDAICRKALAMRKEDRYQSATELADDMERYLAGEPVSAYQESLPERTWRWVKRHRTALSRTLGAAVILAIGLTAFELIRSAREREADAIAEAAILSAKDHAGRDINAFRSLMEEARYYAASADPVAEHVPTLDASKVEVKAKAAFAIADAWGPSLDKMPLTDKRDALKKDLYDLLLEVAQLKSRNAGVDQVKEVQALLDRAATFQKPTRSYYRLRARTHDALGQAALATADRKQELDPQTAATAMDHYLVGEQHRVDSLKRTTEDSSGGKQAGIKGLLARRELLSKAIAAYREALRSDTNHYWSHFQLGTCYNGLGNHAEAAEALGTCIALRPDAPWGYSARGLALALSKKDDRLPDAEADLNQALRLDVNFRPARLNRAASYVEQKKYQDAEADFNILLAPPQENRMREAAFSRGFMYLERGMFDKALADFDDVVASGLSIRAVYLHRTRIYLVKEMPAKALENLNLFLAADGKFDPDSAVAYEQRGRELRLIASEFPEEARNRREGVYLLAMEQLQKAVKKGAANASLYDEIGTVEQRLVEFEPDQKGQGERYHSAIRAYGDAIKYAPKDVKLHAKRGWAQIEVGQAALAKEDFRTALAIDPIHPESHTGLGYVEAVLKAPATARRHAALATLHGSGDYLVLHNVACIFGELSKTDFLRAKEHQDLALDHIERAVELWRKGDKKGPNEMILIEREGAFSKALRSRPEFKKLQNAN